MVDGVHTVHEGEKVKFNFEDLEVYPRGLTFVHKVFTLCDSFPQRLQSSLGDQLRRASLSIINNIAKGSDKRTKKEKTRYFSYSLDSARECIPVFSICRLQKVLSSTEEDLFREECKIICRMLNKLIKFIP